MIFFHDKAKWPCITVCVSNNLNLYGFRCNNKNTHHTNSCSVHIEMLPIETYDFKPLALLRPSDRLQLTPSRLPCAQACACTPTRPHGQKMKCKVACLLLLFLSVTLLFNESYCVFSKHSTSFIIKLTENFEGKIGVYS